MTHLVNYENATTEKEKALAAIVVARRKNAKARAWKWADVAIAHAENAGILDACYLVEDGRYPGLEELESALHNLSVNIGLPLTEAPHLLPEPLASIVRLVAGTTIHPGQDEMNEATIETTLASIQRFLEKAE